MARKDKLMKNKWLKIIVSWLMVIIWMCFIFYLSSMNSYESNHHSKKTITSVIEKTVDTTNKFKITDEHPTKKREEVMTEKLNKPLRKVAHASVYFVLAIFVMYALKATSSYFDKKIIITVLITLIVCIFYASSDEYHQVFVSGRTGQFIDVVIDTFGSTLGIISILGVKKLLKNKQRC